MIQSERNKKRPFKVGDRVRYTGNHPAGRNRNTDKVVIGQVYTVASRTIGCCASYEMCLQEVENQYGDCGWFFEVESFELANEQPKAAPKSAASAYDKAMGVMR